MNYEGTGFIVESSKPGRGLGTVGKSVVPLVTCISVRKSIKGPPFSFELISNGNKVSDKVYLCLCFFASVRIHH